MSDDFVFEMSGCACAAGTIWIMVGIFLFGGKTIYRYASSIIPTMIRASFEPVAREFSPAFARRYKQFMWLVGALLCAGAALWTAVEASWGFEETIQTPSMVAQTDIATAVPGEWVTVSGRVTPYSEGDAARGPFTNQDAIWLSIATEPTKAPSIDRPSLWAERSSDRQTAEFLALEDDTARTRLHFDEDALSWAQTDIAMQRDVVDVEHATLTERRIESGEEIYLLGTAGWVGDTLTPWIYVRSGGRLGDMPHGDRILSSEPIHFSDNEEMGFTLVILAMMLVALLLALLCICRLFRVHKTWQFCFLLGLTLTVGIGLFAAMMEAQRLDAEQAHVAEMRSKVLSQIEAGHQATRPELDDEDSRQRIRQIRAAMAHRIDDYNTDLDSFFGHFAQTQRDLEPIDPLELSDREQQIYDDVTREYESVTFDAPRAVAVFAAPLPLGIFLIWLGFGKLKTRRMIDNIAPRVVDGITYGLNEVRGTARTNAPLLNEPIANRDAVCFHYVEYSKVQSSSGGDSGGRVKSAEYHRQVPFVCEDDTGAIAVEIDGATLESRHAIFRESNARERICHYITDGDDLYILGPATIDFDDLDDGPTLKIADDGGDFPFIISNLPPGELRHRNANRGFGFLGFGATSILFGLLTLLFALGWYEPEAWVGAGVVASTPLVVGLVAFLYNDLNFLRQWVRQCWSNIDVSLQKRSALIPQLEEVAATYLDHEEHTQRSLAELRRSLGSGDDIDPERAGRVMEAEDQLRAHLEDLPAMSAEPLVAELHDELVAMEDEIALMRQGYNDAVERYNTRIRQFPEIFIALLTGFRKEEFFQ